MQGVVAIDGKVLRRSFDRASGKSALHMVSAWGCEQRMVLAQIATDVCCYGSQRKQPEYPLCSGKRGNRRGSLSTEDENEMMEICVAGQGQWQPIMG